MLFMGSKLNEPITYFAIFVCDVLFHFNCNEMLMCNAISVT